MQRKLLKIVSMITQITRLFAMFFFWFFKNTYNSLLAWSMVWLIFDLIWFDLVWYGLSWLGWFVMFTDKRTN